MLNGIVLSLMWSFLGSCSTSRALLPFHSLKSAAALPGALPLAGTGTAALPHPCCVALCVPRAASELQAYQQELRNQATALAGHLRLGWLDCSEPGNDVICEEQLSRTTLDSSGGAEQEEDEQDDASNDTQEFDPARLPVTLLCDRLSPSTGGLLR